jgi:hypothetical protein
MQGFPLEGYEPLPPNSLNDIYHEEVDNHLDVGSDATPLLTNPKIDLVMVEEGTLPINPTLQAPLEPLLVYLDFFGNIIEEYYPCLSSRPYTETNMESTQPNFNNEYMNHVHSTGMVNPQKNPIRSIWRTPSGCDLYERFNFIQPPFDPLTSVGVEVGPSGQTIDHPIKKWSIILPPQYNFKVIPESCCLKCLAICKVP